MVVSFLVGLLLGFASLLALQAFAFLYFLDRITHKNQKALHHDDDDGDHALNGKEQMKEESPFHKQGFVWILEPEKAPKIGSDGLPTLGPKEKKNKNSILEVSPVKKYAKIDRHSLILSDPDSSQAMINLLNCIIVSISASDHSSRKWSKRYPIKLESKESSDIYNGSNTLFLYSDTSWDKESWCRALRLASVSSRDGDELQLQKKHSRIIQNFQEYLASLNAEYPYFTKPNTLLSSDTMDRINNRSDGPSSKVKVFLKKITRRTTSNSNSNSNSNNQPVLLESKISGTSPHGGGGERRRVFQKLSLKHSQSPENSKNWSDSFQDLQEQPSLLPCASSFEGGTILEEKSCDEGTLCLNMLFARLFFDAKMSDAINNSIRGRIQRTLASMRTPGYIGEISCTNFSLGNLPPYIQKIRALPLDLNELWAFEVDFEYSSGMVVNVETRLDVRAPELENEIVKTSLDGNMQMDIGNGGDAGLDLLEGIEHYGSQFRSSYELPAHLENKDEIDGLKHSKSMGWATNYKERCKHMLHSLANKVSQVPLSLSIKVTSVRGTMRMHIKSPPSDQIWYGFTSMPDIDWNMESAVGDRKITSNHIASVIGNRFKALLCGSMILPNCENICIPWMLSEKDDWAPRKTAPFMWINQESNNTDSTKGPSTFQQDEANSKNHNNIVITDSTPALYKRRAKTIQVPVDRSLEVKESSRCNLGESTSTSTSLSPLKIDKQEENSGSRAMMRMDSPTTIQKNSSHNSREIVLVGMEEDEDRSMKPKKVGSRRARMMDFGKRMGDKLEEKRRQFEEKGRHVVEKMRENTHPWEHDS